MTLTAGRALIEAFKKLFLRLPAKAVFYQSLQ
jgi:hypothetical protein